MAAPEPCRSSSPAVALEFLHGSCGGPAGRPCLRGGANAVMARLWSKTLEFLAYRVATPRHCWWPPLCRATTGCPNLGERSGAGTAISVSLVRLHRRHSVIPYRHWSRGSGGDPAGETAVSRRFFYSWRPPCCRSTTIWPCVLSSSISSSRRSRRPWARPPAYLKGRSVHLR